jgi:hypothetical protein
MSAVGETIAEGRGEVAEVKNFNPLDGFQSTGFHF